MKIEITPEQANKAIALIDVAVKAVGINAAKDALEIAQLIQAALVAEQESKRADDHAMTRAMLASKEQKQ